MWVCCQRSHAPAAGHSASAALPHCPNPLLWPPPRLAAEPGREGEELEAAAHRSHRRGLSPFVFVPWDQVASSPLNLPVSQMDVFIPG